MSTAEDIVNRGNYEDEVKIIKKGISDTLPAIIEDYNYESENIEKIEEALFKECCRTIVEHSERLGTSIEEQIMGVAEDFKDSPNSNSRSNIMIFIGSLSGANVVQLEDSVQREITLLSGKILEDKYSRE